MKIAALRCSRVKGGKDVKEVTPKESFELVIHLITSHDQTLNTLLCQTCVLSSNLSSEETRLLSQWILFRKHLAEVQNHHCPFCTNTTSKVEVSKSNSADKQI